MLQSSIAWIVVRLRIEIGQDLIEYAVLGGFIAAVLIAVGTLTGLTTAITAMGDGIGECIDWNGVDCTP